MRRKTHHGSNFRSALNLADLRNVARRRLPHFIFEYVDGGAEDEVCLRTNRTAFERYALLPRSLVDVSQRSMSINLFGRTSAAPLIVAPTGFNGLLTRDADCLIARAAAAAGIPSALSMVSNATLEAVAQASAALGGRHWFQLYLLKDRRINEALVARALAADCEALIVTTDAAVLGNREWDKRNYAAPMQLSLRARLDVLVHPRWLLDVLLPHGAPRFANLDAFLPPGRQSAMAGTHFLATQMDASITWSDIQWLRKIWPRRLIVKGLLRAEDAQRAFDIGADAVVLTNHGGRQLDHAQAPLAQIATVRRAVGKAACLIVDSGFRRGTDVVKALALGANAVMLGRPVLYGVASGGEAGVTHALKLIHAEIDRTLGQLGVRSCAEIDESFVVALDGMNQSA
jgi:(S)-mandelate dehydrogenase